MLNHTISLLVKRTKYYKGIPRDKTKRRKETFEDMVGISKTVGQRIEKTS